MTMAEKANKLDMKKTYKQFYTGRAEFQILDVSPLSYVTYEGMGTPYGQDFLDAMAVLYGTVYTIKFQCKAMGRDFVVMPLEGQWWTDIPEQFKETEKEKWRWNVMIAVPDYVDGDLFEESKAVLGKKKDLPGLDRAKLGILTDGLSAQFLYRGPYSEEGSHIDRMHRHMKEQGFRLRGRHREIYLNSPQRVSPDKLRTIIRQPIEPA